jgi:hypothetical protein
MPCPSGGCRLKTIGVAKHVEPRAEGSRTRVRFPPPPPNVRKRLDFFKAFFFYFYTNLLRRLVVHRKGMHTSSCLQPAFTDFIISGRHSHGASSSDNSPSPGRIDAVQTGDVQPRFSLIIRRQGRFSPQTPLGCMESQKRAPSPSGRRIAGQITETVFPLTWPEASLQQGLTAPNLPTQALFPSTVPATRKRHSLMRLLHCG